MSDSRPRRALWSLLVALAAPLAAAASESADPLDALMRELAARRHGHVAFTEVQYLAMLDRPLESSGELFYEAPDRLEKRTLSPRAETLVLAHGVLSATRGQRSRTLELAAYPQLAPLLESLRATLAGDRTTLERVFSVTLDGDSSRWTLHLAPRDPAAAHVIREVVIAGEQANLRTVEILQGDGDRSLLTIGRELPP
ncbi:MAG: LolA-related protein [Steroidobacteraceae bacterium]